MWGRYGDEFWDFPEMFRGEYEEILKVHDGSGDGHPISKYPARDPVNIPELRDTITRAKQCQQTNLQEEEKGNEGISMSVRQQSPVRHPASHSGPSRQLN